jgi:hypothetical protein
MDILISEIEACEKLLKYTKNQVERNVMEKEISDVKLALELISYASNRNLSIIINLAFNYIMPISSRHLF